MATELFSNWNSQVACFSQCTQFKCADNYNGHINIDSFNLTQWHYDCYYTHRIRFTYLREPNFPLSDPFKKSFLCRQGTILAVFLIQKLKVF